MADPIEVVRAVLAAASPVTNLVQDRISPIPRKQGEALPSVVLRVVNTVANWHLQGDGNLDQVRVQVNCYAATEPAAAVLGDAVRAALGAADRVLQDEFADFDPITETPVVIQDYFLWINPVA